MKILILAGGSGTRLWPLSREQKPKQVIAPYGNATLLRQTVDRLKKLAKPTDIFIVCGEVEKEAVKKDITSIPSQNIIAEPARRGTAPAIAYAMQYIAKKDPDAPVVVVSSDAFIGKPEVFVKSMQSAAKAVIENPKHIVIIGAVPKEPDTRFGYIIFGDHVWTDKHHNKKFLAIQQFCAKPDVQQAEQMITQGNTAWNMGIFIARAGHFLQLFEMYIPRAHKLFKQSAAEIRRGYIKLPSMSFDEIVEKEIKVLGFPVECDWMDVGTWSAVAEAMEVRKKGEGTEFIEVETKNVHVLQQYTDIKKKKIVATVDVKDLVIVDTDDVLLITSKAQTSRLRDIIAKIKKNKKYASYL